MTGPPSVDVSIIFPHLESGHTRAWRTIEGWRATVRGDPAGSNIDITRPNQDSSLLDLPAELRTQIYELVLIEDTQWIQVNAELKEPPLLSTCAQIRNEASVTYYGRNNFWSDHEGTLYYADQNNWSNQSAASHFPMLNTYALFDRTERVWAVGLMGWCIEIHRGKGRVLLASEGMGENENIICEAHQIAADHAHRKSSLSDCLDDVEDIMLRGEWNIDWTQYEFLDGTVNGGENLGDPELVRYGY